MNVTLASDASVGLTDRIAGAQAKAAVLREALPWLQRYAGAVVVIKYGGSAMEDHDVRAGFAADVALLHTVGLRPIVVHGGGPQISTLSRRLGLEPTFVHGLRVTDDATLEVARMVLMGQVNPDLVRLVRTGGAPSVGIAGTDGGLLRAEPATGPAGEPLGHVGEVTQVDPTLVMKLLDDGFVPVVATIATGPDGDLNVNADTAAGAIAAAVGAVKLIYLTDVPGLYEDLGDEGSLVSELALDRLRDLLAAGRLHEGMAPKARSIIDALDAGVPHAHVLDGRVRHAVLLEIFTDEGVGTMIAGRG